jgi:tetratricopeptide (TPR) repeat protein
MSIRFSIGAVVMAVLVFSSTVVQAQEDEDITTLTREMITLQQAGRHAEALPLAIRALALVEDSLEPDHPTIAIYVDHLGVLYHALGQTEAAQQCFQRALDIQEKQLGPEHIAVSTTLVHYAKLYVTLGEARQAEPLLQRALTIREKALGPQHGSLATVLIGLAAVNQALARYDHAETYFKGALEIQVKSLGPAHPAVASILERYAALLLLTNRAADAAQLTARAQAIRARSPNGKD